MFKLSYGWAAMLMIFTLTFTGCGEDDDSPNNPIIGTITDVASGDDRFTTLTAALVRAGLDGTLDTPSGRFTVFAPTDAAFTASGIDLSALSDGELRNVLLYHVISGSNLAAADVPAGRTELATQNTTGPGDAALPVTVDNDNGSITINGNATVVVADIVTVNGTIHAIDQVLLPPSLLDRAVIDGRFTILAAALERTGLDDVIDGAGNFTVFAPTDAAFAGVDLASFTDAELTNVLLYHVLGTAIPAGNLAEGDNFVASLGAYGPDSSALSLLVNSTSGAVTVNGDATMVVVPNVFGTNGVIHAIDMILSPQTILDFATKAIGTSELESAVVAAGLVTALSGTDPLTVFAPVNAAFEAIADTVATLSPARVANILLAHVVNGNVTSDELTETMVGTLNTDYMINLSLNPGADSTSVDDDFFEIATSDSTSVNFILTDIQGTNGVIHLINEVLLPENF